MALTSIVGNASLITKVYIPKYIYPLTRILSSLINLLISMIPLIAVALISGLLPAPAYVLSLYAFVCLALFCLGLGMLLSAAMVFFRDIQFLWGVLTTIWMYLTPHFLPGLRTAGGSPAHRDDEPAVLLRDLRADVHHRRRVA